MSDTSNATPGAEAGAETVRSTPAPQPPTSGPVAAPTPNGEGAWSASQKRAHAEMQELRADVLAKDNRTNVPALEKWRALRAHVYEQGPIPKHWTDAPKPPENEFPHPSGLKQSDFDPIYKPATHNGEYTLQHGAHVPADLPLEENKAIVDDLRGWMGALKMPAGYGSEIMGRLLHHANEVRNLGLTDLDGNASAYIGGVDLAEMRTEADRLLAGRGGYQGVAEEAQAWLDHCLTAAQQKELQEILVKPDGRVASFALDPVILLRLSSLARAHGLVRDA